MVLAHIGSQTRNFFQKSGAILRFLLEAIRVPPSRAIISEQLLSIGLGSLPIVLLASMFVGFIATWQVNYFAGDVVGLKFLGMIVMKVVFSELGPTLTGLVLTGRIGAKVAAEIGSMRVTEQIDAMTALSLPPLKYTVTPRFYATLIMAPVLFVYGSIVAIVSSQILATVVFKLPPAVFYNSMKMQFHLSYLHMGLVKSSVFGVLIVSISSYYGYTTKNGALGVGESTRNAVVVSTSAILIFNLIISKVML